MKYIIKNASGDWTHVRSSLTIEEITALVKDNHERYILFNEEEDIIFIGTEYLRNCVIMADTDLEPTDPLPMIISDYF